VNAIGSVPQQIQPLNMYEKPNSSLKSQGSDPKQLTALSLLYSSEQLRGCTLCTFCLDLQLVATNKVMDRRFVKATSIRTKRLHIQQVLLIRFTLHKSLKMWCILFDGFMCSLNVVKTQVHLSKQGSIGICTWTHLSSLS